MKPAAIEQRIAFVVHEPTMWAHYSSVWRVMDPDSFVIVLTERFRTTHAARADPNAITFVDKARSAGYRLVFARDLLREHKRYKYAVSNHKLGGYSPKPASAAMRVAAIAARLGKRTLAAARTLTGHSGRFAVSGFAPVQYWPLQVGQRQVRFMYGADIGDGWSLAEWNAIYDAFLCHGPNDASELRKRFRGRAFQMGYPRYDGYFSPDLDISSERSEFRIDQTKPTILWMPTYGAGACSILFFAHALASLTADFNFVVRPHPLSFREDPEQVMLLHSLGFRIDGDATRDMNRLYRIADFVLCDYGGSAFSALYLRKRMVLLNVPGATEWYTVRASSNLEIATVFPSITPETVHSLPALLANAAYWEDQGSKLDVLSGKYFADLRGSSAQRAADLLLSLDTLLSASDSSGEP
jgi:CDP-glycerol glycerophosphotransferase (TagB/SpsB family)